MKDTISFTSVSLQTSFHSSLFQYLGGGPLMPRGGGGWPIGPLGLPGGGGPLDCIGPGGGGGILPGPPCMPVGAPGPPGIPPGPPGGKGGRPNGDGGIIPRGGGPRHP